MKFLIQKLLLGIPGFEAFCRLLTRKHVRCLMYHRFSDDGGTDPRYLDSSSLRAQMVFLTRFHHVISPDRFADILRGKVGNGFCPVVITIDDGYRDFFDIAFPVFSEFRIPALLFVTTGFVSGKTWLWWDKLSYVLNCSTRRELTWQDDGGSRTLNLISQIDRDRAWNYIADRFRFMSWTDTKSALERLAVELDVQLPDIPPVKYAAVTWDEIRKMGVEGGMYFGAHTVNHPILTRVGPEDARKEVLDSKRHLEKEIGKPIDFFAYPQGGPADFDAEIVSMARVEFTGSFVAYQDMEVRGDPMVLPRYAVTDDMIQFRWSLCGAELIVLRARILLGLPTGVGSSYWADSGRS